MNLLIVTANDRPSSQATSPKMYEAFMEELKNNDNVNVTVYDVYQEDTPYLGQDIFNAYMKLEAHEPLTESEERLFNAQKKARDLFEAADTVAFVFPLWNLTIPAKLQTFVDYVFAAGYTFKYDTEGNMIQLMNDKKVILLNARGGVYSTPEMQPMEMAVNYMRTSFGGVMGMEIIDEVIIEGHNQDPVNGEAIVAEGLEKVRAVAKNLK
ncbi:FMN-dependent NADH-azoreductase 3 [Halolactibacillus alkaliphilus]|uniref:FMN dependent NADH:quinone oxidoreductase n=1 Tax=Halolactibacillus alkaliphilus TaxID=442899 RepID=A0A511X222_9BACI|nr:FMN-dependent NADH-azoreductase [Halolactibacillus alkaliphilus]GEN56999.1 FMN-dependent NADH-azoreductase 3 [Halolactibacillus alkaliphilus]GGN71654.1 FMN-dependent NADH-azoreductase 3 [Halolactibacillus alkaliphilus]SFO85011.1 FMN-dependent NADH-azoreductase [Halolactibacillus alkaliphilus]